MDIGDVVVLKSGDSPKMVINEIEPKGDMVCMWYSEYSGRFESQMFNKLVIKKFDENINSVPGSKK